LLSVLRSMPSSALRPLMDHSCRVMGMVVEHLTDFLALGHSRGRRTLISLDTWKDPAAALTLAPRRSTVPSGALNLP
jgi:hypothetical protein